MRRRRKEPGSRAIRGNRSAWLLWLSWIYDSFRHLIAIDFRCCFAQCDMLVKGDSQSQAGWRLWSICSENKADAFCLKKNNNSSATYQTLRFVIVRLPQVSSTPVTDVFPARLAMQSQPSLCHADFFKGNNVRIGYNYWIVIQWHDVGLLGFISVLASADTGHQQRFYQKCCCKDSATWCVDDWIFCQIRCLQARA